VKWSCASFYIQCVCILYIVCLHFIYRVFAFYMQGVCILVTWCCFTASKLGAHMILNPASSLSDLIMGQAVAWFKVPSHLPGVTEDQNLRSGWPVRGPQCEWETSRVRSSSANRSTAKFGFRPVRAVVRESDEELACFNEFNVKLSKFQCMCAAQLSEFFGETQRLLQSHEK
jgi:hypothetical protein